MAPKSGKLFLVSSGSVTSWKESTGNEAQVSGLLLPRSQLEMMGCGQAAKRRTEEQSLGIIPQPQTSASQHHMLRTQ